jgi:hypothetical protein
MILQVFSVYDKAVHAFMQPFYARSKGEALRSFTEACNQEAHNFNKHSADFSLMLMGEFDDSSGIFSCTDPSRVVSAAEVLIDDPFTPETNVTKIPPRGLPM